MRARISLSIVSVGSLLACTAANPAFDDARSTESTIADTGLTTQTSTAADATTSEDATGSEDTGGTECSDCPPAELDDPKLVIRVSAQGSDEQLCGEVLVSGFVETIDGESGRAFTVVSCPDCGQMCTQDRFSVSISADAPLSGTPLAPGDCVRVDIVRQAAPPCDVGSFAVFDAQNVPILFGGNDAKAPPRLSDGLLLRRELIEACGIEGCAENAGLYGIGFNTANGMEIGVATPDEPLHSLPLFGRPYRAYAIRSHVHGDGTAHFDWVAEPE